MNSQGKTNRLSSNHYLWTNELLVEYVFAEDVRNLLHSETVPGQGENLPGVETWTAEDAHHALAHVRHGDHV